MYLCLLYSTSSYDSPKPKKKTSVATNRAASKATVKKTKTPQKRQAKTKSAAAKPCYFDKRYAYLLNE